MKNPSARPASRTRGSALLVVLAFLLLLTTLTVAFLSRATFERQLSNASFSQGKVDLAGQGAITAIIGDLQQEIMAGSNVGAGTTIPTLAAGYYYPNAPATVVPFLVVPNSGGTLYTPSSIVGTGLEDLVKISYPSPFYSGGNYNTGAYPAPPQASSISTTVASLNGRSVTAVRWNKPLLMAPTSSSNFAPSGSVSSPNWIYVARDGSNPTSWDSSYEYVPSVPPTTAPATGTAGYDPVTQRYAYAIYDEGSTLDLNVAGSPFNSTTAPYYSPNQPYKNALQYADLTQLPGIGVANGSIAALTAAGQQAFINAIVGWRNFASAGLTSANTFPNTYTLPTTTPPALTAFDQNVMFNPGGFLAVNPATPAQYGPMYGPNHPSAQNQTDNAFTSRQQMLQFFLLNLGQNTTFTGNVPLSNLVGVLPYLGTFSRDLNQPSYAPDPNRPVVQVAASGGNDMAGQTYNAAGQNLINPAFLNVTAPATSFTRNDGTASIPGEPLVKKRFALMRLAWLTYRGPSADRTWPLSATAVNASDPDHDLYLLINNYGIPASFLQQGTDANIAKYFGLAWVTDTANSTTVGIGDGTQKWKYEHGSGVSGNGMSGSAPTTPPGRILTLTASSAISASVQAAGRDPDFFELLKAAVNVGAIAKPGTPSGVSITTGANNIAKMATPSGYSNQKDSSVDAYIMQLGANIIAQSNPSDYCPRIIFDDGQLFVSGAKSLPQEYRGVEDLPYLYRTRSTGIKTAVSSPDTSQDAVTQNPITQATDPGGTGYYMEVPEIWNPHAWNPNATVYSGISPIGAAGSPEFRLIMLSNDPNGYYNAAGTSVGTPSLGTTQLQFWSRWWDTGGTNGQSNAQGPTLPGFTFSGLLVPNGPVPWITFNIPSTGLNFFREPTLLNKPDPGTATGVGGPPFGSNVTSSISPLSLPPLPIPQFSGGYITSLFKSSGYALVTDNKNYLGFCLSPPINSTVAPYDWYPQPTLSTTTPPALPAPQPPWTSICSLWLKSSGQWYRVSDFGGRYDGYLNPVPTSNYNFTYRLQYLDPLGSGNYITYDEKFMPLGLPWNGMHPGSNAFSSWPGNSYVDPISGADFTLVADPRTNRWSNDATDFSDWNTSSAFLVPPMTSTSNLAFVGEGNAWTGWADGGSKYSESVNAVMSAGPDYSMGWPAACLSPSLGFYNLQTANIVGNMKIQDANTGYITASAIAQNAAGATGSANLVHGLPIFTNGGSYTTTAQYYADPDGVVRRGTAGYLAGSANPTTQPLGLPFATSTSYSTGVVAPATVPGQPTNNGNRPVMLHRPFRTVAELGYTFSGTPGKNIDFSTPESGYSGLLDVFCINDTNDPNNLVAGKVNINTRQAAVLEAILGAAYKDELASYFYGSPIPPADLMLSTEASALITDPSNGLINRTTNPSASTSLGPLRNISELVGKYVSKVGLGDTPTDYDGSKSYSGFSGDMNSVAPASIMAGGSPAGTTPRMDVVQRFHEAAIRALAANTTSRVWNLMIDVIAQTGRFPTTATGLANFSVEGERRYWVHVAIDRYTGKVLDEQVEEVKE